MNKMELKKRFLSLEKYLDKIYVILNIINHKKHG